MESNDRRFQELENKFVFQERAIDKVNEILIDQERRLEILEETLKKLLKREEGAE